MSNKTSGVLKWFALVITPTLATFAGLVDRALNWQRTDIYVVIITGFDAFLGSAPGVSNRTYKMFSAKSEEGGNK